MGRKHTFDLELSGLEAARDVAIHELRQMAAYELQHGDRLTVQRIDIVDESRWFVGSVYFDEAMDPLPPAYSET